MNLDEMMRGYCRVLDSCETKPRDELRAQHVVLLERLCRHARATTDFYQNRLDILFDAQDHFRMAAWDDVPPLRRQDLIDHFDQLKSNKVPANFGATREARSSGSTGQPVRALWTDTQVVATHCVGRRLHLWHGVDPRDFLLLVYSSPLNNGELETEHTYWAPVYQALDIPGRCVMLNGQLPVAHIVERLEALGPDHLNINPRLLYAIANDYLARGATPGFRLKTIGTFGETRTQAINQRSLDVFGCRPYSRYTADEVGHIAIECPDCGLYHVAEEVTHVDVVDATAKSVLAGSSGQILTTPLYSYAMPLIRYEVGDEVLVAQSSCAREQGISLGEIIGRTGDLFHHPQGGRFRPTRALLLAVAERLDAFAVQIVQTDITRITVRYQSATVPQPEELRAVAQCVQDSIGFRVAISLTPVSEIPARANGKREDFVCEIRD